MNIFEQASRLRIRFDTPKGLLSTEDLWELPLTGKPGSANLDDVARGLYRQQKEREGEMSFVRPAEPRGEEINLKFSLVKHVIDVKVAERDAAAEATKRRETKQRLLELIAKKEDEALAGKSVDELRQLAQQL